MRRDNDPTSEFREFGYDAPEITDSADFRIRIIFNRLARHFETTWRTGREPSAHGFRVSRHKRALKFRVIVR